MKRGKVIANLDWITVLIYLLMVILGWLNIYSAVYSEQHPEILDMNQRYGKQFLWMIAAFMLAIAVMVIDYRFYEFFAYFIYGFAILLLLFVLIAGKEINGAKSWFVIGSFQVQPSEFAKPAVALALAKYLTTYNINIQKFNTFVISASLIFLPSLLILLQPDTGSALVFFAFILTLYREGFSTVILLIILGLVMLFLMAMMFSEAIILALIISAGMVVFWIISQSFKKSLLIFGFYVAVCGVVIGLFYLFGSEKIPYYHAGLIALAITSVVFAAQIYFYRFRKFAYILLTVIIAVLYTSTVDYSFHHYLSPHQQRRINIMLGIESDPLGAGYNLNQSLIAIGSGGLSGKGYLNGTQTKLRFVPEQSTDFIFCTVGEEWGFLGTSTIIILFMILFYRLIFLAERQRNHFARIYGYGLISLLFFHFTVNIAMTVGLFPVIGIPLPFFSYGGSSLWAFTILLFVFLRFDAGRTDFLV